MTAPITLPAPALGAAAVQHTKDQLYLVRRGFLYTKPSVSITTTSGFPAVVLLTVKRDVFQASVEGHAGNYSALATKPLIARGVQSPVPTLTIGVAPNHQHYRKFRTIPDPGALPLDREAFARFDAELEAASRGDLSMEEAVQLFEGIVETAVQFFPPAKRTSRCIEQALAMLQRNPHYPLDELANAVGLSYDRMSYLFAEGVGLPLRSYLLWQKIHIAASLLGSGRSLTEIALAAGFADSAHLSNTWHKTYGVSPSYFFNSNHVTIHSQCQSQQVGNKPAKTA